MKVIQELVAYLERRGRLTQAEVRKLLDQGLLAADAPPNMLGLCDQVRPASTSASPARRPDRSGAPTSTRATPRSRRRRSTPVSSRSARTWSFRVIVEQPLARSSGSVRHGVTSNSYGRYGARLSPRGRLTRTPAAKAMGHSAGGDMRRAITSAS